LPPGERQEGHSRKGARWTEHAGPDGEAKKNRAKRLLVKKIARTTSEEGKGRQKTEKEKHGDLEITGARDQKCKYVKAEPHPTKETSQSPKKLTEKSKASQTSRK